MPAGVRLPAGFDPSWLPAPKGARRLLETPPHSYLRHFPVKTVPGHLDHIRIREIDLVYIPSHVKEIPRPRLGLGVKGHKWVGLENGLKRILHALRHKRCGPARAEFIFTAKSN